MKTPHVLDDEPFFREWHARAPGQRRSLSRARTLMEVLGIDPTTMPPTISVVGSKGKGTAAAAASVSLLSQGFRVGSIISPAFRSNRERIRLNAEAVGTASFHAASIDLAGALKDLPPPSDGYLSPSGAFLVSGLRVLLDEQVDFLVVEEGMGGRSDEISLISPDVLVVTPIFLEHGDIFGDTIHDVARELLGVTSGRTRVIVTLPEQPPQANQVIRTVAEDNEVLLDYVPESPSQYCGLEDVRGLSRRNALLGVRAAEQVLGTHLDQGPLGDLLSKLWLPGRLSVHKKASSNQTWVVDAAINRVGVDAALSWCRENVGEPETVLLSLPLNKDRDGCLDALEGLPVIEVSGAAHMQFATGSDGAPLDDLDTLLARGPNLGRIVLALGTITFIADVLDTLDVDTSSWLH